MEENATDFLKSVKEQLENPALNSSEKKRKAKELLRDANLKIRELRQQRDHAKAEISIRKELIASAEELHPWLDIQAPMLEKNDCTRLHKLVQASVDSQIIYEPTNPKAQALDAILLAETDETFVLKHNWASAFGHAIEEFPQDQFVLPYDTCAFELRISGRNIIVLMLQKKESDIPLIAAPFIESKGHWWRFSNLNTLEHPTLRFAWLQVRAACIALDAEVAVTEVKRAPSQLNKKRRQSGLVPLFDYHIVDLSRRHRVNPAEDNSQGTKKRLHFRRGHWRHFESHKTWIKWMLVGDPELGYIDKHYLL